MGAEIKKDIGMRLIKKIHLHLCVCITTLMAAICFNHLASAIPLGFEERFKRMPTDKNLVEAQELLKKGKPDEAIEKVNQAIRINPNSALAHEFLGKILIMEGEIDKGLKELQKAVELRPLQSSAITKIASMPTPFGCTCACRAASSSPALAAGASINVMPAASAAGRSASSWGTAIGYPLV